MKTCTKCGETKPLEEFGSDKGRRDGKRSHCKPCVNAATLARTAANRDKYRAIGRESARKRRAERGDEFLEQRRHKDAAYRERRRDELRDRSARYYLASKLAPSALTRWGHRCCYCDAPATALDHITPISKGGADAEWNLVPACQPCNSSKGAKSLAEWAATF